MIKFLYINFTLHWDTIWILSSILYSYVFLITGMSFSVFFQLYRDGVICKRSLRAWKNKNKSSTRTATAAILTSFFIGIDTRKSIENKV